MIELDHESHESEWCSSFRLSRLGDRNLVVVVVVRRGLLRMVAVMVSPFDVLALEGVSGEMMLLVCDDSYLTRLMACHSYLTARN